MAETVLAPPHVLVSAESGVLARPREIALDSSGRLYVLDQIDRRVVVITPEGEVRDTIGGPGPGPGEFSHPLFLGVAADRIRVFDYGRTAIQVFSTGGAHIEEYRTAVSGVPAYMSFRAGEALAYASLALPENDAIAAVVDIADPSRQEVSFVGDLVSEDIVIPQTLLEQVHERRLPGFMRNSALPVFTPDGGLWVFLQTEGVLERLGPDGSPLTRTALGIPEMELIEEDFFDWYSAVTARGVLRLFSYVEAGAVVDGSLWLLWNTPGDRPGLITVHDDIGGIKARLVLRGSELEDPDWEEGPLRRRFAVDRDRRRLYLIEQSVPDISWIALPPEVFAGGIPSPSP